MHTLIFKPIPLLLSFMYPVCTLIMSKSLRLLTYANTFPLVSPRANNVTSCILSNRFLSSSFHTPFLSQKIGFVMLTPRLEKSKGLRFRGFFLISLHHFGSPNHGRPAPRASIAEMVFLSTTLNAYINVYWLLSQRLCHLRLLLHEDFA